MYISDWPSLSKTGKNIDRSGDHKIVHCLSGIADALISMTNMIYVPVMHIPQNPNEAKVYSIPEHIVSSSYIISIFINEIVLLRV